MPLRPGETLLLLVDPQECFISHLCEEEKAELQHKLDVLCRTAKKMNIPVITTKLGEKKSDLWPHWLKDTEKIPVYSRSTANPWDHAPLKDALKQHRPRILFWQVFGARFLSV